MSHGGLERDQEGHNLHAVFLPFIGSVVGSLAVTRVFADAVIVLYVL